MRYAFYPGCSLEESAGAYDQSVRAVSERLGIELIEVDDWNCCGATEYWTREKLTACALVARNLARVDPALDQIVAPCAACYLNLRKVDALMTEDAELADQINEALFAGSLAYDPGRVRVRHLLDVVCEDIGETAVRAQVKKPLKGLRIAPYYGCQVVRPYDGVDDPEYPVRMDQLLTWLGAEVVDYPVKSHCCGGHMTQISEPEAFELIRRLLHSADQYDADVIACMCPMCQLNLDGYQGRVNNFFNTDYRLPILFFTQLMGLAFGFTSDEMGMGKEIVGAGAVLEAKVRS
jgi:heterodisulfide reductase subunit B